MNLWLKGGKLGGEMMSSPSQPPFHRLEKYSIKCLEKV